MLHHNSGGISLVEVCIVWVDNVQGQWKDVGFLLGKDGDKKNPQDI